MKYVVVTEVDAGTGVPCVDAPMRTGPAMPAVKGLTLDWADRSTWPIELAPDGCYLRTPRYYATCDDDAATTVPGVLEILTESQWMSQKYNEFYARQPYQSWIWDPITMTWSSPVPYPAAAKPWQYRWDEEARSWVQPRLD